MPFAPGTYFGPYRIIGDLGKGGMGEVYRAKDTRLERQVAIKVLSEHLAGNEKALIRFEREAKTLAALSHPNIVVIHDIGTDHGLSFVAMELLEGENLRRYVEKSSIPWRQALEIGSVIADALGAAHSKGVTHRDLKPENIFLTTRGIIKVLDFGLARMDPLTTTEGATVVSTGGLTESGMVMGTVQYMSPEQARGQLVDHRTDIWAFGCVLYEMLTQRRAFQGNTFSDTVVSLLMKEPQWELLPPDLPAEIKELLMQCVQKEMDRRVEDVAVIKNQIDSTLAGITSTKTKILAEIPGLKSQRKLRSVRKRIRSLVVLPLANLSNDPEKEYFTDGMTESLISGLAKLGSLRIISRTSAMCYKGTTKPLPQIARELNVDAVLEGSVMQAGQRVRITVQLISAATDMHLWAEDYDRDLQDVLLLQSEVAQSVAQKIQVTVTAEDNKRLQSVRKVNPDAYENYLKGRFHMYKFTPENLEVASGYFRAALQNDPKYAAAYSAMAELWVWRSMRGFVSPIHTISKAKENLQMAMRIDDSLPEVHTCLGLINFSFDWDWEGAANELRKALQLNGNSADAHFHYGGVLLSVGRAQEAREAYDRALNLDPLNSFYQCMSGWLLVNMRQYDEAIAQLRKVLITEPNFSSAHLGLWGAYYKKRMYKEALEEAKLFFAVIQDTEIAQALTGECTESGYREAMSRSAKILMERSMRVHVPAIRIARLHAHAGSTEQTLQWLEKAYDQREGPLLHLKLGWDWEDVRDHPRFQKLLLAMNIPSDE